MFEGVIDWCVPTGQKSLAVLCLYSRCADLTMYH